MGGSRKIATAAAGLAGLISAAQAQAQAGAEKPGEYRFTWENDEFLPAVGDRTDRFYTNGLRLERLAASGKSDRRLLPGISHDDWCLLCGDASKGAQVNTGYAVGQSMYTPELISIPTPQPNDRPWAGLLWVSRIARITQVQPSLKAQRQDRIEVSLGVVGPASLAGDTQTWWHTKVVHAPRPRGWHDQLRNEPVLQLRYDTALRWPRKEGGRADIIPRLRANVGNALTSLEADLTLRIGYNLSGFGVHTVGPDAAPPPAAEVVRRARANALRAGGWRPSFNLFVRGGANAIAHNIFLDGNTFARNDIRIRRKPFVTDMAAGVEIRLGRLGLTYQIIRRSSEFSRQKLGDGPPQKFGSFSLAWTIGPQGP
jgi:lipid A 3-O-deacylase